MGYLSCRAQSSISTCRSISAVAAPSQSQNKNIKKQPQHQKRSQPSTKDEDEDEEEDEKEKIEVKHTVQHFTYAELESATNSFSESSLLGRGSHGSVYKATVFSRSNHPIVVAVKRPSPRPPPLTAAASSRSEVENEIEILSHIRSPRLVNLIGFSSSSNNPKPHGHGHGHGHERLLVVEFMPNGTLYDFIHNNPRPPNWPRRLRLALQTAKALLTLHSARPPVIHRDVKSANILIDRNLNARLADFGLALRLDDPGFPSSCRSTPPAGTLGYLDPCYVTPDNLSTKTDVFSFGILLLELMSGRKAIDVANSPPSVVEWAVPLLRKGKVRAIYDPRISPPRDSLIRRQLALLAASCVRSSDERRPLMEEVVQQLKLLSQSVSSTVAKPWDGLLVVNPCSMVETGSNLSKVNAKKVLRSSKNLSSAATADAKLVEEKGVRRVDEIPAFGSNKPPLAVRAVNSSASALRPLTDERQVFLGVEAKRESKNLKELLSRSDGEILEFCGGRNTTAINRARAPRLPSDYNDRCESMRIHGHQTVKGARFESPAILTGLINSSESFHSTARDAA